jgi:hypothetical protein
MINLCDRARYDGVVVLSGLAGLTTGKFVHAFMVPDVYTGKGTLADEIEYGSIQISGVVTSSTEITFYWSSYGLMIGNVKIAYSIGL